MQRATDPRSVVWFDELCSCHWCGRRYGAPTRGYPDASYCHVNCRAGAYRWRVSARQLAAQLRRGVRPARTPRPWIRV